MWGFFFFHDEQNPLTRDAVVHNCFLVERRIKKISSLLVKLGSLQRGHSKTTMTNFCSILTTYPAPVDRFTKEAFSLTLIFEEPPRLVNVVFECPLSNTLKEDRVKLRKWIYWSDCIADRNVMTWWLLCEKIVLI